MSNIDEDIDVLKNIISDDVVQFYCTENAQKLCDNYCEKNNEDCFYLQAIENVIKKLEEKDKKLAEYRKFHDRRLKGWKKKFEKQEEHFLKELDEYDKDLATWKKIAERLADELDKITEDIAIEKGIDDFDFCKSICHIKDGCVDCKECLLDWARKEVENNDR